ncbi:MAG: ABC transporter substrate-binding protein [Oligoflexia bacterium]|nr:ABC transporter substrate-binding protein [Oligoflexia bacterium]
MRLMCRILVTLCIASRAWADAHVVGVTVDLSGAVAPVGNAIRNAIVLAQEEFAPNGDVHFVFEDDGFQPKNTLTAIQKLRQSHGAEAFITFGSGTSLAAVAYTENAGLPLVALAISERVSQGKQFAVRHFVSTHALSAATVAEVKRRAYRRVAVISLQQEAMAAQRDEFKNALGERIAYEAEVLPTDTDFLAIATRVRASKADAVYLLLLPPQLSVVSKLLRSLQFKGDIFGSQPMGVSSEIAAAQGALEGAWYASSDDRAAQAMFDRYKQRFGGDRYAELAHAYDAAHLLINALRSGNTMGYLRNVNDFHGAFGTYKSDGENGFAIPATIKVIQDGEGRSY